MSRVLPKDCDHPEESLGPLPYRAGRPPRADEWECGVCGMWNVAKEPEYKRRFVGDDVEARPKARPYTHVFECGHYQGLSPMHVGSHPTHPSHMGCTCACHIDVNYDSAMWTWPTPAPAPPVRGTGYLPNPAPAEISAVNALIAQGKIRSMDVSIDVPSERWVTSFFSRHESPGLTINAIGVAAAALIEVMTAMHGLVKNQWTSLRWEISKRTLLELQQRSAQAGVFNYLTPTTRPTVFGGDIAIVGHVPDGDIRLVVR